MTLDEIMNYNEAACDEYERFSKRVETYLESEDNAAPEKIFASKSALLTKMNETMTSTIDSVIKNLDSLSDSAKDTLTKVEKYIEEQPDTKNETIKFYDIKNIEKVYKKYINLYDKNINLIKVNKDSDTNLKLESDKELSNVLGQVDVKVTTLKKIFDDCVSIVKAKSLDMTIYSLEKTYSANQISKYVSNVQGRDTLYINMIKTFNTLASECVKALKKVVAGEAKDFTPKTLKKEVKTDKPSEKTESTLNLEMYLDNIIESVEHEGEYDERMQLIESMLDSIENEIDTEELSALESEIAEDIEQNTVFQESVDEETDDDAVYEEMLDDIIAQITIEE